MAKRKRSRSPKRKPRKAAPRRRRASANSRTPMARKATKRRKARPAKTTRRRRSSGGSRGVMGKVMAIGTPIVLGAAGYLAAQVFIPKLLPTSSAKTRTLAALGGAIALGVIAPSLLPVAIGMGTQGAVTLGADLLKLPAMAGIRGLNANDDRLIARMAAQRTMVNGSGGMKMVNGLPRRNGQAASMVNGFEQDTDAAYDGRCN